jgi:hypothetical protein
VHEAAEQASDRPPARELPGGRRAPASIEMLAAELPALTARANGWYEDVARA